VKFLSLIDMIDGGGAGQAGDRFEGGGLLSDIGNLLFRPHGYRDRMEELGQKRPMPRPAPPMAAPAGAPAGYPRIAPEGGASSPVMATGGVPMPGQLDNPLVDDRLLEALSQPRPGAEAPSMPAAPSAGVAPAVPGAGAAPSMPPMPILETSGLPFDGAPSAGSTLPPGMSPRDLYRLRQLGLI